MMVLTPDPLVHTLLLFLRFGDSVGSVGVLVSDVFVQTGFESKCNIFVFFVFVPIRVESKGG